MAGEHLTKLPYGYMANHTDKKKWIVDEEAAVVVKQIFDLCIAGKGPSQIAKILKADNVPIAKVYYAKKKVKATSFLTRNRNGKAHKDRKRRYSPCNGGYTA